MKNLYKNCSITSVIGIIGMALVIGLLTTGCKTLEDIQLDTPKNVQINVDVRQMIVTWDAVPHAQGYIIETTSEGCGSGNRTVNTKEGTAVITANGNNALFDDGRNGAVKITGKTEIEITLMPEYNIPGDSGSGSNDNEPMPTSVAAKVMAIGGKVSDRKYTDSSYSNVVIFTIK